jgi:hypothetical protein
LSSEWSQTPLKEAFVDLKSTARERDFRKNNSFKKVKISIEKF